MEYAEMGRGISKSIEVKFPKTDKVIPHPMRIGNSLTSTLYRLMRVAGRGLDVFCLGIAFSAAGSFSFPATAANIGCSHLPPPVADRIGRVELFISGIRSRSDLIGKFDIVWADYFYKPGWARSREIYSIKYMTATRDPNFYARIPNPRSNDGFTKTRDLRWYHRNHPDWVVYKCPGVPEPSMCRRPPVDKGPNNPAYECFFPNSVDYVPLDVNNPAVRQFLFNANLVGPPYARPFKGYPAKGSPLVTYSSVLGSGLYDAVGVDNLENEDPFGACGIYRNGTFVRRYSGTRVDPRFVQDQVDWMNWLRRRVNAAGLCLVGNDYFNTANPDGFLKIAATLDIVADEHGFTRETGPMETGAAWRLRIKTYRHLIATGKPLIIVDHLDPPVAAGDAARAHALISWSIANYLLVKGDLTYLGLASTKIQGRLVKAYPGLFIETGRPGEAMQTDNILYWRHFEHALAIVNPSLTPGYLNIGKAVWRGLDKRSFTGRISVPPASALVLVPNTP
jgi:hypothetical protein